MGDTMIFALGMLTGFGIFTIVDVILYLINGADDEDDGPEEYDYD